MLSNWGHAGSEFYETSFVGSAYRLSCSFEVADDDNMERVVGCLLMSAMPPSGVHDAVATLWERYQFSLEDLELDGVAEVFSLHNGVAASDDIEGCW
jgi:hypothetical protein